MTQTQLQEREEDLAEGEGAGDPGEVDAGLDELCWQWAAWCRTRRLYAPPSLPISVLGRMRQKGTGRSATGGPDARCSAELLAFNIAVAAQPKDALDTKVFVAHYYWGVTNIKSAAAGLEVSRQHWYRLLAAFRRRVYIASREILEVNRQAAEELPSRREVAA